MNASDAWEYAMSLSFYMAIPSFVFMAIPALYTLSWVLGTDFYDAISDKDMDHFMSWMFGISTVNVVIGLIFGWQNPINWTYGVICSIILLVFICITFSYILSGIRNFCLKKRGKRG